MAIGTALAIGATVAGSALSASSAGKGAKKAADASVAAAKENNALTREIYAKNEGYLTPYISTGQTAGNYLNAFLGLPTQATAVTPAVAATPASGASPAAQVQYLLGVGDSKTGRAMQNYYNANQSADPASLLATLRGMADAGERSKLDAYVAANPVVAASPGTPAITTSVTTQDAQNAFGNYIANSDYGFQFATGANQVNSGYAGSGSLQSGAAMKALEKYRQNLQSGYRTEYTSALGNQQGVGLSAGSALAGVGQNMVNTISANNNNAANAIGNAALIKGQNNPFASALGALGGGLLGLGR